MLAGLVVLLLVLALTPFQALADDGPLDSEQGAGDEEVPLGVIVDGDSPEEPLGETTVIDSLTFSSIGAVLVPGQTYSSEARVDKGDPNYSNVTIVHESWAFKNGQPTNIPSGYTPAGGGYPFDGPDPKEPVISPEEIEAAGYQNTCWYRLVIKTLPGYEISNTMTLTYAGKTYHGRLIWRNGRDFVLVFDDFTTKVAYPVPLYRMYNTKTSEHLWTRNKKEYDSAGSGSYADWRAEGVAWYAPAFSGKPVYRLYNTKSGDHHYTTSAAEKASLLSSGQWRDEGVAFYSATKYDTNTIKVYRVYNGRLKRGQHHYTKSATERDSLVKNSGWKDEGVGFYGYSSAKPKTV